VPDSFKPRLSPVGDRTAVVLNASAATAQAAQVQAQQAAANATQQTQRAQVASNTATAVARSTQAAVAATAEAQASATQQVATLATTVATTVVAGPADLTVLMTAVLGPGHPLFSGSGPVSGDYRSAREFVVSSQGWPAEKAVTQSELVSSLERAHVQRVFVWQQTDSARSSALSVHVYEFAPGSDVKPWFDEQQARDTKNTTFFGASHLVLTDPRIGERGYLWAQGDPRGWHG
jgi:hypothetical protein